MWGISSQTAHALGLQADDAYVYAFDQCYEAKFILLVNVGCYCSKIVHFDHNEPESTHLRRVNKTRMPPVH